MTEKLLNSTVVKTEKSRLMNNFRYLIFRVEYLFIPYLESAIKHFWKELFFRDHFFPRGI